MDPLLESNLIGADASILTFIRGADQHGCRLVVAGERIFGLVSLSDLHRLPVRAALFGMVTHLESEMMKAIQREFNDSDEWIQRLLPARQTKISEEVKKAKSEDVFVDTLLFTQFNDKVTIIKESPDFLWSKTKFKKDLHKIELLRDMVAQCHDRRRGGRSLQNGETDGRLDRGAFRLAPPFSTVGTPPSGAV